MTATQARAALPEILDRVKAGEEITITRHGEPVAVVVRPDSLRSRRTDRMLAGVEQIQEALERGRATPLFETGPISEEFAEELIAEIRAGRDRR